MQAVKITVFEKLSGFHIFLPGLLEMSISFQYKRKIQEHGGGLNGGKMPPGVLAAEMHFSCSFTCWSRAGWMGLGEYVREISAFYKELGKDKLCCKLKNNSDHAKST